MGEAILMADNTLESSSRLSMSREEMFDLTNKVSEILVDHNLNIASQNAWDGEFSDGLARIFATDPPEDGRNIDEVLEQATQEIFPYSLNLAHPKCFGFVSSSPTWPSVIADFLTSGMNPNVCTWLVASGPSQIELTVIEWIRQWLGYPDTAGGLLTSGTSAASVEAFVVARESAQNPQHATVYMSDQTHQSLIRAARVIGIATDNIKKIPSDDNFAIDVNRLAETVAQDVKNGFQPVLISANAGTTSTGAIDSLEWIADFCESQNIWFHVDAAYGGFACITQQGKKILKGIERADSITLDAHKWLFQPYEVGCLIVKDLQNLESVYGMRSDVLQDTVWGKDHPNLANRGIQLSRTFRAFKIWMSVQSLGMKAFRDSVERCFKLAEKAQHYIKNNSSLQLLSPVVLSVVCFRFNPENANLSEAAIETVNRKILVRMFWENDAFMSSTIVDGKFSLRICIVNYTTTWKDVEETLDAIESFGTEALESS